MSARSTLGVWACRSVQVILGLVVASTLVGPARTVDAQSSPTLGGMQGSAAASGLHATYNPAGLLPIPPPVDIGAPDALATIASGPSTFARASVADPGDLLANPGALLALASPDAPEVPAYPFRITANSGVGAPSTESNPAPGLNAKVTATDSRSSAVATMPLVDAPAIATFGTMSSQATTETNGSTVTVHSRSEVSDFNVLGLVQIDSIVTDLVATSDGTTTTFSGGSTVTGASVLGSPVTIDSEGVHQEEGAPSLLDSLLADLTGGPSDQSIGGLVGNITDALSGVTSEVSALLEGDVNDLLATAGIKMTLAKPVETSSETAGERRSNGLRIDVDVSALDYPLLADLIGSLPPIENPLPGVPGVEDLLAAAKSRQLAAIEVGRAQVTLEARPGFEFNPLAPPPLSDLPSSDGSGLVGFDLPAPSVGSPPTAPGVTGPGGGNTPVPVSNTPAVPAGVGVGSLVLFALIANPFVGERLARGVNALLAADNAEYCPLEEL